MFEQFLDEWKLSRTRKISIKSVAGATHSLALTSGGQVVQWPGQTNVPSGLSKAVAIAAGYNSSLALTTEGRVVEWGTYGAGQI